MIAAANDLPGARTPLAELSTSAARAFPTWRLAGLTAVLGTILFYLPVLAALNPGNAHWPGFMLTYDQEVGYFPYFVEGYRRFWHGGLLGLDFFTEDGASIFAFRPNLSPFYPPFLVAYLLFDCSDLRTAMSAFLGIHIVHQFFGLYFTVVFVHRFLRLPTGAAVLAASLYGLSWYTSNYLVQATFYFQIMFVPVLACALCWLMNTRSRLAPVWMSAVFACYLLSSYAPMMLAGFGVAIFAALIAYRVRTDVAGPPRHRALARPAVSMLLAGAACAPYFYAQLRYKSLLPPGAENIDQIAHTLSLTGLDLLNGLSQFLEIHRTRIEAILVWGAVPSFLCLIGLNVLLVRRDQIAQHYLFICGTTAALYLVVLLPTFGSSLLVATDSFFYAVPLFGVMHIYQRYLIFSQFFFSIMAAALTTIGLLYASVTTKRVVAHAGIIIWLGLTVLLLAFPPGPLVNVNPFLVELFLVAVAGIAIAAVPPAPAFLVVAALCAMVGLYPDYAVPINLNVPTVWATQPDPLGPELRDMVQFIKANDEGKALSKIVVASAEVPSYFNRNLPWLLGSEVKLMNFQGYPPHLSALTNYSLIWGTYGRYEVPWLQEAGADFVFWNDATAAPLAVVTEAGFKIGPVLALPGGNHLGRLTLQAAAGAGKPPASFDNGILRVLGSAGEVKRFETDYTKRVELDIDGPGPSTIFYELWPNPYMVPFLDGKRTEWDRPDYRPVTLTVGPGPHRLAIRFVSRSGSLFVWAQAAYWLTVAASILGTLARTVVVARHRRPLRGWRPRRAFPRISI